ncbi:hypothetical protein A200_04400, partial [Parascardovia denticolens IPLA 20019]
MKGLTHLFFAVLQFTAVAIFIFDSESRLSSLIPSCMGLVGVLMVIIRIGLYGLVAAMILPFLKRFFGLLERTYLYSANLYLLLLAALAFAPTDVCDLLRLRPRLRQRPPRIQEDAEKIQDTLKHKKRALPELNRTPIIGLKKFGFDDWRCGSFVCVRIGGG